jgi:hypothetical protein
MSTKTLRKRIALVAVATLGAGVLSVVPASAGTTDALTSGSAALTAAASTVDTTGVCALGAPTVASTPNAMQVGGTQTVTTTTTGAGYLTLSGPARWKSITSATVSYDSTRQIATATDTAVIVFEITGAGSVTLTTSTIAASATALQTFYITAVTSCVAGVIAANSYVQVTDTVDKIDTLATWATRQSTQLDNVLSATTMTTTNLNTSNDVRTTFANNAAAYIAVATRDAYTARILSGSHTLIISCDNGAKVGGTAFAFYSNSSFDGASDAANIAVRQATAGTPMTTTCAVSMDGVALATKKITFTGDLAKLTIAASRSGDVELAAGGRISYVATDSAGNKLTSTVPTMTSGIGGTVTNVLTEWSSAAYYAASNPYVSQIGAYGNPLYQTGGYATFNCLDYGNASITAYAYNTAGAKITSNAADVRCGGAIDTWTASLDKAKYNQGDIATLTITAKDAGGGATAYAATPGDGYSVAMPGMTAVVAPATTDTESTARAGVWTYTYTVNLAEGSYNGAVKIVVASTSAQYNKAATVAYSIGSAGGVTNADVLKAIVSLIASINKQIAALQKALLKK